VMLLGFELRLQLFHRAHRERNNRTLICSVSLRVIEFFAGPGAAAATAADSRCPGGFVLTPEQLEAADRADRAAKAEKARVARGGRHAGGF
jgi:hypothetical protein